MILPITILLLSRGLNHIASHYYNYLQSSQYFNPCPAEQIKMPHQLLIFSQSGHLILIIAIDLPNLMANSADLDQLASSEANWSGSTLFAKQGMSGFSRTRVNP